MPDDPRGFFKRLIFPCQPRLEQLMNVHKAACENAICAAEENKSVRCEIVALARGVTAVHDV